MHNPLCKYITKTILINGISHQVQMEIDPNDNAQAHIETSNRIKQGFSGIRKGNGNMAAFRIQQVKNV